MNNFKTMSLLKKRQANKHNNNAFGKPFVILFIVNLIKILVVVDNNYFIIMVVVSIIN